MLPANQLHPPDRYPVMETFYSLQGEGQHSGKPAYFIRLAGCQVGCHWCDVKESWDAQAFPLISADELVNKALAHPTRLVIITGGEPLHYDLSALTSAFSAASFRLHLETSGAYALSGHWDWITFSPKKFKAPLPAVAAKADELKIVVYNQHDFTFAEEQAATVKPSCQLCLQPEWSKEKKLLPTIISYLQENPQWRLSLQTHKYLQLP